MNNTRTIRLLVATYIVTACCQVLAAPKGLTQLAVPKKVKSENYSVGGTGVDGGGGNQTSRQAVGISELELWTRGAKVPAKFILKSIEFHDSLVKTDSAGGSIDQTFKSLMKKLFHGPVTIYQALDQARLTVPDADNCYDRSGVAVDGSATSGNDICISAFRLSKILTRSNAQQELLALLLHEVSHTIGASEAEATMLQTMAKGNLSRSPIEEIPKAVALDKNEIQQISDNINNIMKSFKYMQVSEICLSLGAQIQQFSMFTSNRFRVTQDLGYAALRPSELAMLSALTTVSVNASYFCYGKLVDPTKIEKIFNGREEISFKEYYSKLYDSREMMPAPNWTISRVRGNDKTALKTELHRIQSVLSNVLADF